jgi:hypothetical protein
MSTAFVRYADLVMHAGAPLRRRCLDADERAQAAK